MVKQLALAIGPAVGGPMGASLHAPYVMTFVLSSLGITLLAIRLGRHLTVVQDKPWPARNRVVSRGTAAAEPAVAEA